MKYQMNRNKFLNERELKELEVNLNRKMLEEPDKFLPILIALKTGCRRSELQLLKVENIDFQEKTVFIQATKNSNDREIPLEEYVLKYIKAYIDRAHLESGDLLFWSINPKSKKKVFIAEKKIQRIWHLVRPVSKKFHSLRHTFAMEIYKKHRDINLVMAALGHRNIQNTMIYVEYSFRTEELRRLILEPKKVI